MRYSFALLTLLVPYLAHAAVFRAEPLSVALQAEMRAKGWWKESCPVPLERLALLHLSYIDFDGKSHDDGEMIVMDVVAPSALKIFQSLYAKKFPIEKIRLTSVYDGDDKLSMNDNNSSAYNCRENSDGSGLPSLHAYGLAIDINTKQNPFVQQRGKNSGAAEIEPAAGLAFLNRANQRPGMAERVTPLFAHNGFSMWGGTWNDPIDWQHFQTSRTVAALLAAMTPTDAATFFALYQNAPAMLNKAVYKDDGVLLVALYQKNPQQFLRIFTAAARGLATQTPKAAVARLQSQMP